MRFEHIESQFEIYQSQLQGRLMQLQLLLLHQVLLV